VIPAAAVVRLRHARLRRRGEDLLLLGPERGLVLRGSAPAVLALVDGQRSLAAIVSELARAHGAPAAVIERDVVALFEALARRHLLEILP
jgi:pyrroloquinoline-quinone synthase/pyrroloquinoline quinone biosynthesis protein D